MFPEREIKEHDHIGQHGHKGIKHDAFKVRMRLIAHANEGQKEQQTFLPSGEIDRKGEHEDIYCEEENTEINTLYFIEETIKYDP